MARTAHRDGVETVPGPYGPLSLVGTHGIEDFPDGRLPAIPARWTADGDGVVLTAETRTAFEGVEVGTYDPRSHWTAAGEEGRTTVDFDRPLLPPDAFAGPFVCPFPLPGHTLNVATATGERNLRTA